MLKLWLVKILKLNLAWHGFIVFSKTNLIFPGKFGVRKQKNYIGQKIPEAEETQERWEMNSRALEKMLSRIFALYKMLFFTMHTLPQAYSQPHTKAPPLGNYCTKYLVMTAIYLLMRKTIVRLNIVRVCNPLTLNLSVHFNSSHLNNIHKSLLLWYIQC